jgi:choline transport protein
VLITELLVFVTLTGFFAILITCLSRATPKNSDKFVWTTFVNNSGGWPDAVSFLTGLIAPNYMYAGLDGAIHLCEECKDASRVVPRAVVSTQSIGFVTSFAFAVAMTYCIKDFDAVLTTPTG